MMAAAVKGHSVAEAAQLTHAFKALLAIPDDGVDDPEGTDGADDGRAQGGGAAGRNGKVELGELEALRGVVKFPSRIKCATLAWNTLTQALDESASTTPSGS
jgi:nitrogen fixation NifU-like protein